MASQISGWTSIKELAEDGQLQAILAYKKQNPAKFEAKLKAGHYAKYGLTVESINAAVPVDEVEEAIEKKITKAKKTKKSDE